MDFYHVLKITMLGDFTLQYGDEPIVLERNNTTKATKLLQYFLYHDKEKIPREKLLNIFYAGEDVSNPSNNLKVNISRLRRLLSDQLKKNRDYISFSAGMYYWNSTLPLDLDVRRFEQHLERVRQVELPLDRQLDCYMRAVELYKGDFLPMLATEEWVVVEAMRLRKLYFHCVEQICRLHRVLNRPLDPAICKQMVKLYPFEEQAHAIHIRSLLDAGRKKEALMAYHDMAGLFFEEMGVTPSEELEELYHTLCEQLDGATLTILDIRRSLQEDSNELGAYYCNLLSFIDCYRVIARVTQRNGLAAFLMLCTLTDAEGRLLSGDRLREAAELLHRAIRSAIRRGDTYTRYNRSRYLVLLVGICQESCIEVANRIFKQFRGESKLRGIRLQHSIVPATDIDFNDGLLLPGVLNPQPPAEPDLAETP